MKTVTLVRLCTVVSLLASSMGWAETDAVIGTWKLNVAKSKYDPGPAPRGSTLTFEVAGDGIKTTAKGQDAAGNPTSTGYTAKYDGKDYPVALLGTADFDTLSLKRIDAFKAEGVVSPDGKTLTLTVDGTDAKGRKVHNVIVYDKQ
jgi:hypothetical protein